MVGHFAWCQTSRFLWIIELPQKIIIVPYALANASHGAKLLIVSVGLSAGKTFRTTKILF